MSIMYIYCWNLKINLPINPNCSIVGLDLDIDGLIFFVWVLEYLKLSDICVIPYYMLLKGT